MKFSPNMEYRVKKGNSDLKLGQDGLVSPVQTTIIGPTTETCGAWTMEGNTLEVLEIMKRRKYSVYRRRSGNETGH